MASDSANGLRKRSRCSNLHNSTETFFCDSYGSGNKRPCQMDQQQDCQDSPSSSSSSCSHASCVSSPPTEEVLGEESPSVLQDAEWGVTASAQTADSTTGSCLLSASPGVNEVDCSNTSRPVKTLQQLRHTLSQEAESCCHGEENQVDINCFLLEGWEDIEDTGGLGFDPGTVFYNDGTAGLPADRSDDAAFGGCSAENGNWFLNDLEIESNTFLNEVLDQEWMAAAVANLDRINDTLDADSCMLHLLEYGAGI